MERDLYEAVYRGYHLTDREHSKKWFDSLNEYDKSMMSTPQSAVSFIISDSARKPGPSYRKPKRLFRRWYASPALNFLLGLVIGLVVEIVWFS